LPIDNCQLLKKGQSAKIKQSFPENLMKWNISELKFGEEVDKVDRVDKVDKRPLVREALINSINPINLINFSAPPAFHSHIPEAHWQGLA
jgi:hypothetical protein